MENANLFEGLVGASCEIIKAVPDIQNIFLGYAEAGAKRAAGEELTMEDIGYVVAYVALMEYAIESTKEEFADCFKLLEES